MSEGRARRRRWNSEAYPRMITVRVTREEHAEVSKRAALARMSQSRYLAHAGLRGTPRLREAPPPTPEERRFLERLLFLVHQSGMNLNRLAHRSNGTRLTGETPAPEREVESAAQEAALLLTEIKRRL